MKVLMVEPGKIPYETEIGDGLEASQAAVGGDIQALYPYSDPVAVICNEDGKSIGLPLNRALSDEQGNIYDVIKGKFFICGLGEENFSDLSADLMEKYRKKFEHPEEFICIAGKYLAVKQPIPSLEEQEEQLIKEAAQQAIVEEMRLEDSTQLAFDFDEFFRQNSESYSLLFPDAHAEKEYLADVLLSGQTSVMRMRLATLVQEEYPDVEVKPLMERISAYEEEYGINAYSVYQLTLSDRSDNIRFMPYDWVEKQGLKPERDNYCMVYSAELPSNVTLEDIFVKLNKEHPEGYKGHSLAVSDVVVLHDSGTDTAYYVDSVGFKELPGFWGDKKEPETKQNTSVRGRLDDAKRQVASTEPKTADKKKEPERS